MPGLPVARDAVRDRPTVRDAVTPPPRRLDLLENVLRTTAGLADGLTGAELERPTPCEGLDVRELLEHIIGWQQVFATVVSGGRPHMIAGSPPYRASGDLAGDLTTASNELLALLARHADATVEPPYRGPTPVTRLFDELVAESVIHTWDLASALERPFHVDPATLTAAHEGLTALLQESFAPQAFGPQVDGDTDGDLRHLLRRSGRIP